MTLEFSWQIFQKYPNDKFNQNLSSNKYYIFWVYICSLDYPTCKAHLPYYTVIFGLPATTIFLRIIANTAQFSGGGGECIEHKMWVLISFTNFISNISHSKKIQWDIIINVHMSSCKVNVIFVKF